MATNRGVFPVLPAGKQPAVERVSAETSVADTFAGRVHVEWDDGARVTPLGQLPFFIEYLKQGGLFDGWVSGCPLYFSSPNAPSNWDVLGTVLLSVLAGHWRYAHMTDDTALRPGQSAAAGHAQGGQRGRGTARLRQDRGGRGAVVAAGASRLLHAAAS
jgi:hypothetical protein